MNPPFRRQGVDEIIVEKIKQDLIHAGVAESQIGDQMMPHPQSQSQSQGLQISRLTKSDVVGSSHDDAGVASW